MRTILLLAVLVAFASATAQPASGSLATAPTDRLDLPGFDNQALWDQSEAARRSGVAAPLRFAEPVEVSLDAERRSGWETQTDGSRVWRLLVTSPGAYSLSFGFTRFRLPEGATLWIYPEGGAPEYRPFTAADNEVHGELWTPIVPGDRAVIEVNLPAVKAGQTHDMDLVLGQVNHSFRPVLLTEEEKASMPQARLSGSCNVDVVCPEGDGYRDIIRSVGAYTVGGVDFCSGAAINTTAGDDRALFLTADHCGIATNNQAAVVVYWNYQNSTCRTPGSAASGANGDGSRAQFNSGTVELGDRADSDWSILEFDDPILAEARVYLAGWDRRDLAPTSTIAIHHPSVEEKRISFDTDASTLTTYLSSTQTASGTHIRVANWETGTTEGGSSGSPLFNSDRRIVGQLHGGYAACSNDSDDWYGRLFRSMNDGLATILDPGNTGAQTVDGTNYAPALFASATTSAELIAPGESTQLTFTVGNPTADAVAGATFTATLPNGLSVSGPVSASYGSATASGTVVTWTGTLTAETDLVVVFDAVAAANAADGVYDVLARTVLGGGDPDLTATVAVAVVAGRPAPDAIYEATPSAAIPDANCSSFLTSTVNVPASALVARVSVGTNITHTWRGDLRLQLTSPEGTTVTFMDRVGQGTSSDADNMDVLVDDAGVTGTLSTGNHNVSAPFYDVEVSPESGIRGTVGVGALATFIGEDAQGAWTLGVCDGAAEDLGTLNRWALYLVESEPVDATPEVAAVPLALTLVGANPVGATTRARISVDRPQHVRATLVDATGRTVRTLFDGEVRTDIAISLDVAGLSAGAYFVRVDGATASQTLPVSVVR